MAKNQGRFLIDDSISAEDREGIIDAVRERLEKVKNEISEREPIITKRQDFYEGRHHKWTNVVNQVVKQQEGHILAVFNYIYKFCLKLRQSLTNTPPKIKIKPKDEANEIETTRAERVEEAIMQVLSAKENLFFPVIYKKCADNQIRDGDFTFDCRVMQDGKTKEKKIIITPSEDLLKLSIGWDDAQGTSYSFTSFSDLWSIDKIKREYGYEAEPISEEQASEETRGTHLKDQYGVFATNAGQSAGVPTGKSKIPKARITDYWGYEIIKGELKVINLIFINKECVQFVITDYREIPRIVGHSLRVAGKPWSKSFIDDLIDPQIELNDRTGEEGDLIRIGSHMKFLAVNMPDFEADSVRPGSGQVIYIEGENADFRPLQMNISPFPSADYINRVLEHMHNLGLPKIALAAGTAPYTGRVGAIQYQPFADLVQEYRSEWEVSLTQLFRLIQQYFIDYFPETHIFMREAIEDPDTGEITDGEPIIRDIEYNWDNILPLSRSDKVIDASTMRDRGAISLHTYLEEAGFRNPSEEIKKLKKESKDPDMMVLRQQFAQLAKGTVEAQLEAQKEALNAQETNAENMGNIVETAKSATPKSTAPILNQSQNEGRRGILSSTGTPTGQTATPKGAVAQASQNINAQQGV